tara:strand:- start:370 stop:948 length:579 start_codon:yes stop_codon:yes gene_type:complete
MINLIDFAPNLIAIFIFVLVVSGNYLGELFPCQVQRIFANSMVVKHALGFMTLLFFVVLTIPEMREQENMLGYTGLVYIWFIMMAKCYYTLWFVVFGIVGIIYILQMYERGLKDEEKEEKKEMIEEGKKYLSGLTLVLTVVGFLMYMGAKKLEYKDKFKYITFLFGKPNCKGNDYNKDKDIGYLNILKHSID